VVKQDINIVWLKRDLRLQDHAPLHAAEQDLAATNTNYIIVFLFEPSLQTAPDVALRHQQFQYHSLLQMNKALANCGRQVQVYYEEVDNCLAMLLQTFCIKRLFSYQEYGTLRTYVRDKAVTKFCMANNIQWQQYPKDGVIRASKNRDGWDKYWYQCMHAPIIKNTYSICIGISLPHIDTLPPWLTDALKEYSALFQPAGETYAFQYLHTFLSVRGYQYSWQISKPHLSRRSCSRLSPYLAWGNISVRQVYQHTLAHTKVVENKQPFLNFITRLKWHCHFIQKFETACIYETHCINPGFENNADTPNEDWVAAWKTGHTGYPLVDACMRCLQATGWINFRMRAMVVSFLTHYLMIDWRQGAYHLAKLFLDYEPGIHYPQIQMQAGTTGINTLRIYNAVKQSEEHDADGIFIKKWCPELSRVPLSLLHEPWKMTAMEQTLAGCIIGTDYAMCIVPPEAIKENKAVLWARQREKGVQQHTQKIIETLTRNNKGRRKI
jgi:deoxyribodipyrimidine photo-lyase